MKITKLTTNSRYAKLHDDVTFYVQYEGPLTQEEIDTTWEVFVLQSGSKLSLVYSGHHFPRSVRSLQCF